MLSDNSYSEAKVLLVDDNQINLYVLNKIFEQFGVAADCVPSGKVCIKKAEKKHYDLIFMDHMMPDLDGIETLKKLKENPEFDTPVVVLTANYGQDLEKQYKEAGFAEYMMKPANPSDVKDILDRFYSNKSDSEADTGSESSAEVSDGIVNYVVADDEKRNRLLQCGFTIIDELIAGGMSADEYEEILDIFREESKEKLAACIGFYEAMDMKNYAIIVHGLKNDAALISDSELSEHAKQHEIESKADNCEFVKKQWPDLRQHWEDTLERIEKYFG